jgi:predicted tellurium resistance membrane protein TerC
MLAATSLSWLDWTAEPESWVAFATLLAMEIVLGVDNVVFISILADKLPPKQRQRARTLGLALAMGNPCCLALLNVLDYSLHGATVLVVGPYG